MIKVTDTKSSAKILMKILISGGPGSGCTSIAKKVGAAFAISTFDTDEFFHKPTDPPFQEQYTPEDRRNLIRSALLEKTDWVIGGSISNWGLEELNATHGIYLDVPKRIRTQRLVSRQTENYGERIQVGGDMFDEHQAFIEWASKYEERSGIGRNRNHDKIFLQSRCKFFTSIDGAPELTIALKQVLEFIKQ